MKIKWTMDETGEDYTEMMCISCGKYIDKDLFVCLFCDHHYHYVRKRIFTNAYRTPPPLLKNCVSCLSLGEGVWGRERSPIVVNS